MMGQLKMFLTRCYIFWQQRGLVDKKPLSESMNCLHLLSLLACMGVAVAKNYLVKTKDAANTRQYLNTNNR